MKKKRKATLLGVVSLCTALSILETPAAAGCPPLKLVPSGIERYIQNLGSPLSQEQLLKVVGELIKKGDLSPLGVRPPVGAVPLRVQFGVFIDPTDNSVEKPVRIEVDADGDGKPERVELPEALYGQLQEHTYDKEGEYQFTVHIYQESGKVNTYKTPVKVLSLSALDAELKARWNDLKEALSRGDTSGAVECIHSQSRDNYKAMFNAVGTGLGADMPVVERVYFESKYAKYRLRRQERVKGQEMTITYYIYFSIDADGIWRIQSF